MSLIAHATAFASSNNTATTSGQTTTGATTCFIGVASFGATHPATGATVSDSKGNTYTAYSNYVGGGNGNVQITLFRCLAPVVGASHTASASIPSGNGCTIFFAAFDGAATAQDTSNGTSSTFASTVNTGSVTPATATNICLAFVGVYQSATGITVNNSFTIIDENVISGVGVGGALAYKLNQSGAVNPQFGGIDETYNGDGPAAIIIVIKTSGSVGSSTYAFTATATGVKGAVGVGSATYAETATGVGNSQAASPGSASFAFAATAVGNRTASAAGSATYSFAATAAAASTAASAGSSTGTFAATAAAASTVESVGASTFAFAPSGVGASNFLGVGSSSAAFTVSATGSSNFLGVGASSFSFAVAAAATSTVESVGSSTFAFTPSGVGASNFLAVGACSWSQTATAVGLAGTAGVGSSSFAFSVAAAATSTAESVGASTAAFSVAAVATSTAESVGSASAAFLPTAIGTGAFLAAGSATYGFTVEGEGDTADGGIGEASFSFTVSGAGASLVEVPGSIAWGYRALTGVSLIHGIGASEAAAVGASTYSFAVIGVYGTSSVVTASPFMTGFVRMRNVSSGAVTMNRSIAGTARMRNTVHGAMTLHSRIIGSMLDNTTISGAMTAHISVLGTINPHITTLSDYYTLANDSGYNDSLITAAGWTDQWNQGTESSIYLDRHNDRWKIVTHRPDLSQFVDAVEVSRVDDVVQGYGIDGLNAAIAAL